MGEDCSILYIPDELLFRILSLCKTYMYDIPEKTFYHKFPYNKDGQEYKLTSVLSLSCTCKSLNRIQKLNFVMCELLDKGFSVKTYNCWYKENGPCYLYRNRFDGFYYKIANKYIGVYIFTKNVVSTPEDRVEYHTSNKNFNLVTGSYEGSFNYIFDHVDRQFKKIDEPLRNFFMECLDNLKEELFIRDIYPENTYTIDEIL